MSWTINYTETAQKQLQKLDKKIARRIMDYMDTRVAQSGDPRSAGKALSGTLGGLWRYRVADYRIIVDIQDSMLCVLVLNFGNRREIYRKK